LTSPDGAVYEGEWKDGKMHGSGKLTHLGGSFQSEARQDGNFLRSSAHLPSAATSATAATFPSGRTCATGAAPAAAAECVEGGGATLPPITSAPVPSLPTSTKFSLEALQARGPGTAGCNASRLHEYLSDAEFHKLFGMSAADFAKMPGWKQADAKKKHRLF
jgi:hypothetical protein